ncbi:MAG: SurA N-terminal domain-containing protein [Brevinema sp.]
MKKTVFATVNGKEITGQQILRAKKRLLIEHEDKESFIYKESDDNAAYLNSEALQKLIEIQALVALAKFEGITPDEKKISDIIYELKMEYTDDFEWESNLDDLGISNSNLREDIRNDVIVDMLVASRSDDMSEPGEEAARSFYHENIQFMKHPSVFTFLEIEVLSQHDLHRISSLLKHSDTAYIMQESSKHNLHICLNEEIPLNKLPEPLQEMLEDLSEGQIGSLPAEDGSIILVKVIKKYKERMISEAEAIPGLIEYLKIQQESHILDTLIEESLEKCDIVYLNTELLKKL